MDELSTNARGVCEEHYSNVGHVHGGRARILGFPSIRMCGFLGEMVGAACEDGFPGSLSFPSERRLSRGSKLTNTTGDYDVLASFTHARLDGERYRTAAQRGIHMAESIPRLECSFEEFQRRHIDATIDLVGTVAFLPSFASKFAVCYLDL